MQSTISSESISIGGMQQPIQLFQSALPLTDLSKLVLKHDNLAVDTHPLLRSPYPRKRPFARAVTIQSEEMRVIF